MSDTPNPADLVTEQVTPAVLDALVAADDGDLAALVERVHDTIAAVTRLRGDVARVKARAVARAHDEHGKTWVEIGQALGVSGERAKRIARGKA